MPYPAAATPAHPQPDQNEPQWWVFVGGPALSGVAGYVNVILLSFFHVPVSHMSGAVSMFGYDLETGDHQHLLRIVGIVFCFLIGAILSGLIIGGTMLKSGSRYGVALMFEGGLLAIGSWLVIGGDLIGLGFISAACGLQNGMASSYLGLILRTTHVTGLITDIGVLIGHWFRQRQIAMWKLILLVALVFGFLAGGVLGAFAHRYLEFRALWVAAGGTFVCGLGYYLWCVKFRAESASGN